MYLLNQSPDRGAGYEIVGCVTNQTTFDEAVRVERRGVPIATHPIGAFYAAGGARDCRDMVLRAAYDVALLARLEPWFPDVIVLAGYLHLVTAPLLDRFRHRVLNLHFSDLTLRTSGGAPRYPGIRAVRDALAAGCSETRATVHLADAHADNGPPIVRSWPFAVSPLVDELRTQNDDRAFKAYAFAHEQWMLRTVSGPLLATALGLISSGAVDLHALAVGDQSANAPWLLERRGLVTAPELEFAHNR